MFIELAGGAPKRRSVMCQMSLQMELVDMLRNAIYKHSAPLALRNREFASNINVA